jgi:hypothetical protein
VPHGTARGGGEGRKTAGSGGQSVADHAGWR